MWLRWGSRSCHDNSVNCHTHDFETLVWMPYIGESTQSQKSLAYKYDMQSGFLSSILAFYIRRVFCYSKWLMQMTKLQTKTKTKILKAVQRALAKNINPSPIFQCVLGTRTIKAYLQRDGVCGHSAHTWGKGDGLLFLQCIPIWMRQVKEIHLIADFPKKVCSVEIFAHEIIYY